ncbi:MAG: hypothetical protein ACRERV_07775 [Methylococcales bacterium]
MSEIFLSASIPIVGRGDFYQTADPFLIRVAVREFVTTALGRRVIVYGGHPSITPMIWAVCEGMHASFSRSVVLYQSSYFKDDFPDENKRFKNVVYVDADPNDRNESLTRMREAMLSRKDLSAAVFIGGMEGVLDEYKIFSRCHPNAKVIAVASSGGASQKLAEQLSSPDVADKQDVDFTRLFHEHLGISPNEPRIL